jgi:hypothetical protein
MNPAHQFDVQITKHVNDNIDVAWKATIKKSSFPEVHLTSDKSYNLHLNEEKYHNSFRLFSQIFGTLPATLFDYRVSISGDDLVITGLTETTVRVAIVDLITSNFPNASVKMVKPPVNFRVYLPAVTSAPAEIDNDISGIFGEAADY